MTEKKNEPQSYGSEKEWLTGKTQQKLDQQPETKSSRDEAFYESRRESESSASHQGGAESLEADLPYPDTGEVQIVGGAPKKITQYGDKRRSYFRKRDYSS